MSVELSGGSGLRILEGATDDSPIVINGSATNNALSLLPTLLEGVTVSGGKYNRGGSPSGAAGSYSTIGGGFNNKTGATSNTGGNSATVAGGNANQATGDFALIGGGYSNEGSGSSSTVSGGTGNFARGVSSVVGGGASNEGNGTYSTVPGGNHNIAGGASSFAAGQYASAIHNGSFVWGDGSTVSPTVSSGTNQFLVRATGGVGINTTDPAGAQLHVVGPGETLGINRYEAMFSSASSTQVAIRSTSPGGRVYTFQSSNGAAAGSLAGSFQIVDRTAARARVIIDAAGNTYNNSGAWAVISDARLKKNFRPLDTPLATLLTLRGHRFEYVNPEKSMSNVGERMGFVAQEVRDALPQWVHEAADGMLSVTASGFEALAVEAIRELRTEKDREIAQVRAQNDTLIVALAETAKDAAQLRRDVALMSTRLSRTESALAEVADLKAALHEVRHAPVEPIARR